MDHLFLSGAEFSSIKVLNQLKQEEFDLNTIAN